MLPDEADHVGSAMLQLSRSELSTSGSASLQIVLREGPSTSSVAASDGGMTCPTEPNWSSLLVLHCQNASGIAAVTASIRPHNPDIELYS